MGGALRVRSAKQQQGWCMDRASPNCVCRFVSPGWDGVCVYQAVLPLQLVLSCALLSSVLIIHLIHGCVRVGCVRHYRVLHAVKDSLLQAFCRDV